MNRRSARFQPAPVLVLERRIALSTLEATAEPVGPDAPAEIEALGATTDASDASIVAIAATSAEEQVVQIAAAPAPKPSLGLLGSFQGSVRIQVPSPSIADMPTKVVVNGRGSLLGVPGAVRLSGTLYQGGFRLADAPWTNGTLILSSSTGRLTLSVTGAVTDPWNLKYVVTGATGGFAQGADTGSAIFTLVPGGPTRSAESFRLAIRSDSRVNPNPQETPVRGSIRGISDSFPIPVPDDGTRGISLAGTGPVLSTRRASLNGVIKYGGAQRKPTDPKANGTVVLTLPLGTLTVDLASREKQDGNTPLLLFPTTYDFVITKGTGAYQNATGKGTASLVFEPNGRANKSSRQRFSLLFGE